MSLNRPLNHAQCDVVHLLTSRRQLVVHGEQRLKIYEPLPISANILVDSRVTHVIDKGADKGALLVTEVDIKEKESGKLFCTLGGTTFARGDGGFGGPKDGSPEPHQIPNRKPDI